MALPPQKDEFSQALLSRGRGGEEAGQDPASRRRPADSLRFALLGLEAVALLPELPLQLECGLSPGFRRPCCAREVVASTRRHDVGAPGFLRAAVEAEGGARVELIRRSLEEEDQRPAAQFFLREVLFLGEHALALGRDQLHRLIRESGVSIRPLE